MPSAGTSPPSSARPVTTSRWPTPAAPRPSGREVLESGARAVDLADAVQGRDVIVLSIPFGRLAGTGRPVRLRARRDGGHRHLQLLPRHAQRADRGGGQRPGGERVDRRTAGPPRGQGVERRPGRNPADQGRSGRNARPPRHPRRRRLRGGTARGHAARGRHRLRPLRRRHAGRLLAPAAEQPRLLHRTDPRRAARGPGRGRPRQGRRASATASRNASPPSPPRPPSTTSSR